MAQISITSADGARDVLQKMKNSVAKLEEMPAFFQKQKEIFNSIEAAVGLPQQVVFACEEGEKIFKGMIEPYRDGVNLLESLTTSAISIYELANKQ